MPSFRRQFTFISLLLVALSVLASGLYWWQLSRSATRLREETLTQAGFRAKQVVGATSEQISSLFHSIDIATQELAQTFESADRSAFDKEAHRIEQSLPAGAVLQIAVIDASGYLVYSNLGLKDRIYLGDREHFKVHTEANNDRMFISKPVQGRLSKQWSIQFTRPIKRNGRFDGVVVLSVSPSYLQKALASLTLESDDSIAIFRENGDYLARNQDHENALGKNVGPNRPFVGATSTSGGSFRAVANYDHTLRRFEWQRLKDYPISVVLGLSESTLLSPIETIIAEDRRYAAAGTVLLWLFTLGGVLLLRKVEAQNELVIQGSTQLHLLTDSVKDCAIIMLDPQGHITTWNEGGRRLKGYESSEILGKHYECFYTAEDMAAGKPQKLLDLAAREGSCGDQGWRLRKDGTRFYADVVLTALRDDAGRLLGFAKITRDITERKLHQQQLERLLAEQRTLLENELVCSLTVKNRLIQWANPAFEKLLGYPSGALAGASTRQLFPSEAAYQVFGETAYPVLMTGKIYRAQVEMVTQQGRHIWVDISGATIDPERLESLWMFIDITDRKLLENELARHHHQLEVLVEERTAAWVKTEAKATHLLQSSADGLYGVDSVGTITFMNNAACSMLGLSVEQAIGQSAHALFHHHRPDGTPYPAAECPGHNAVVKGEESRIDNEVYWHTDGHAVPVMYAIHPILQDGANCGAVISFVDMSEQRAAAVAREQALIAAENLARVRSEFLSNMSHEIRTPLNGVLGFADIGYRNVTNPEKARNAFEKIRSSGKLLLGVINDILNFSKLEAGKIQIDPTPVSIREVIDQTVDLVSNRAAAKQIEIRSEQSANLPETCITDQLRLSQVLLNLLSNAVKFTETGSITLSAELQDGELVFKVTDTGIGMSTQQLALLFNPFQQADGSTTRRFGGTGLGLAISKRVVELMGGRISVESQPGIGSTFTFCLPYVAVDDSSGQATGTHDTLFSSNEKPLKGLSVLVVEDEPVNQSVLEGCLLEFGASVEVAGNGQEAVDRVLKPGRSAFDVVLMDVQMPEMDGYEASRRIKAVMPDLPIIGQTAHVANEEKDRCLAAGMVAYISKPIDFEALIKLLHQYAPHKE
jgi:PAS domain S-box-containing protein